jgi:hypothetical protein
MTYGIKFALLRSQDSEKEDLRHDEEFDRKGKLCVYLVYSGEAGTFLYPSEQAIYKAPQLGSSATPCLLPDRQNLLGSSVARQSGSHH